MMDDVFALNILFADENISDELYELVKNGSDSQLDARLHELSKNYVQYLTALTWYDQEQLSLLMVAALHGHDHVVRVLLKHCDSTFQIELKGKVFLCDTRLPSEGITALYCACYRGHFTVAKTLIEVGHANVQQVTNENPYDPLFIHAIKKDREDIVKFLLENKYADVNQTKSIDNDEYTALIWASYYSCTNLVKYLIENGANVNYSSRNKSSIRFATAIMGAITCRGLEIVRLLYNAGADMNVRNYEGHNLLFIAGKYRRSSIITFLLGKSTNYTVDDLEFAASSLFESPNSTTEVNIIFDLLRLALQQRQILQIPKDRIKSLDIYDNHQECQTIEELDRIKNDYNRMFIETLLIRERIYLSNKNVRIMEALKNYSDQFANKKEFDKCLDVYHRIFEIGQQLNADHTLARFVWLFCKMLTDNQIIPVDRFLRACYLTFELAKTKFNGCTICNALFLVIIAIKILEQKQRTKEEQILVYRWIKDLCRHQLITEHGETLLHLCVDSTTNLRLNFRPIDTTIHLKFPNESVLRFLLAYGYHWLDLNARESLFGNTPLHIICKKHVDQKMIELLLNSGSHIDCVDKNGKTPFDYIIVKKIKNPDRLKCLCARIIVNQRFDCKLTLFLNKFVFLHDNQK